tara:strand:- start:86 stop:349 length:264 start_codon:yes stop_codon:yes gene_type:complete
MKHKWVNTEQGTPYCTECESFIDDEGSTGEHGECPEGFPLSKAVDSTKELLDALLSDHSLSAISARVKKNILDSGVLWTSVEKKKIH